MATATSSETVSLKGGLVVSLDALQLLWAFEDRGCVVKAVENGALFVGPRHQLTETDLARIRQHKAELLQLVTYCEAIQ